MIVIIVLRKNVLIWEQAGEFMQPIGTTSPAYEPTVITKHLDHDLPGLC